MANVRTPLSLRSNCTASGRNIQRKFYIENLIGSIPIEMLIFQDFLQKLIIHMYFKKYSVVKLQYLLSTYVR